MLLYLLVSLAVSAIAIKMNARVIEGPAPVVRVYVPHIVKTIIERILSAILPFPAKDMTLCTIP